LAQECARAVGLDPARLAQQAGTLATDVRAVIRTGLASGEPFTTSIARKLAMSARTLQRRLAEEDLTVSTLVDEIRRERKARAHQQAAGTR
jgi:AraC-like DNA-binding protein